jgi:hypothetical protein
MSCAGQVATTALLAVNSTSVPLFIASRQQAASSTVMGLFGGGFNSKAISGEGGTGIVGKTGAIIKR